MSQNATYNATYSSGVFMIPSSFTYEIDHNRTDSYTPTGSPSHPFKTIMSAVTAANTAGLVDAAFHVNGPGTYDENVVIPASATFNRISFTCVPNTLISPASGFAFDCSLAGINLERLHVRGFNFQKPVKVLSPTDGFLLFGSDCTFQDCFFVDTFQLKNVSGAGFDNCHWLSDLTFENIGAGLVIINGGQGSGGSGALALITNNANPKPSGFSGTVVIAEKCLMLNSTSIDAGSSFQIREGVRLGFVGDTITVNGILTAYSSFIRSSVTVASGGTFTNDATAIGGTLTVNGGGTYTAVGSHGYAPGTAGDWAGTPPRLVGQALDRLATLIKTLNSGTGA